MSVVNPASANYPLATLYVGDLDPDITEAQLFERFSTAGPVLSIRVCRDQITKHSLGYAYVNFQQPADAERALDTMNFDNLSGRPMRIMWSQRDPALRKSGLGNVFIKNLDKSIDNKALYDTFSTFGNILSCKIMTDDQGNSKGYGFVHFETQEAAEKAIVNVNNMLLNDKKVFVGQFQTKTQRFEINGTSKKKYTNVYVKNFGDQLDDSKLREMCEKFGDITSAVVSKGEDGKSKGFGFVNFKDASSAEQAVRELNETVVNERKIFVYPFQKKYERFAELKKKHEEEKRIRMSKYQGVNLYIKNLDDKIDDDKLRKEFEPFGTITSAKVMMENGRSKGFGFVCFSAQEEAAKAVTEMNSRIVGSKPLYVALAQRKEDRRNHLTNQYMQRIANVRLQNQQMNQVIPNAAGMYLPANIQQNNARIYPAAQMFQQIRPTPRWAAPAQAARAPNASQYQAYQMIGQQQQQRPRIPINTANNGGVMIRGANGAPPPPQPRMNYAIPANAYTIRNSAPLSGAPQQFQAQQQQQQQQQQQPRGTQKFRAQQQAIPNQQAAINVPGQEPLTTDMLAAAQPQEQKQMLGERLYPLIHTMHPEWAGKITGMLLEIDNAELLHMLESRESLKDKVNEAVDVLKLHQAKQVQ